MFFSTLKVLFQHKYQAIPDLRKVKLPKPFRGRPELHSANIDQTKLDSAIKICPTQALTAQPFTLDMGRCLFCGQCARILPDNIEFTTSWHLWATSREGLIIHADQSAPSIEEGEATQPMFRRALKLRQVCAGGDGANEMELNAAGNVNFDMRRFGIEFVASPRHADGVVVTGPVSRKMAEPLEATFAAVPQPRVLIAVGADAISGGLFINGEVDRSFFDRHTPNLYVAGHPAHPLAFIGGVRELIGQ